MHMRIQVDERMKFPKRDYCNTCHRHNCAENCIEYSADEVDAWRENTANWLKSLLTNRDATSPSAVEIIREVLEWLKQE